jgi:type I restriction enzyme, S subunit
VTNYPMKPLSEALEINVETVSVAADAEYRIAGVRGFGKGVFARETIRGQETSYRELNRLIAGMVVMSRLKAFEGAIAMIPETFEGYYASSEFSTFAVRNGSANTHYIKHICAWPEFWACLQSESKGVGARRERVSAQRLLTIEVPLPDLDEQRRIADKLDTTMKRLDASFTLRELSSKTSLSLLNSTLNSISEWKALGEGLSLALDEVPVTHDGTYEMAGVYGFGRGLIDRGSISGNDTKYKNFNRLHTNALAMSRLKAFEGALAVVPSSFEGWHVSPEFPTFSADPEKLDPEYLGHLCRWPTLWALLGKESKGIGAPRERVSAERLLVTRVPFPDRKTQQRIAAFLGKAQAALRLGDHQEELLAALRPALLNAAFSGQL